MRLIPTTLRGWVALFAALAAVFVVGFAATAPGIALGLVLVAVAATATYYVAYRGDRYLKGEV